MRLMKSAVMQLSQDLRQLQLMEKYIRPNITIWIRIVKYSVWLGHNLVYFYKYNRKRRTTWQEQKRFITWDSV